MSEAPNLPSTKVQRHRAREAILQALYQWELSGYPMSEIEEIFLADNDLKRADVIFFHDALTTISGKYNEFIGLLKPHLHRSLQEITPIERNILLLGTYELVDRIDIPFKVVITESVALSKKFGATDGHKFVNGVLDQLAANVRVLEVKAPNPSE